MRARPVDDVGEHDSLSRLELHALRERRMLTGLDVVGDALNVLEGPVVAPDLASFLRHALVGCHAFFRNRYNVSINVTHKSSIGCSFSRFHKTRQSKGLPAGNSPDDHERLGTSRYRFRERGVRRFVRQVLRAGEEAHEGASLLRNMVTDCSAQHRITGLEAVENRALRDFALHVQMDLAGNARELAQMRWQRNADHGSV